MVARRPPRSSRTDRSPEMAQRVEHSRERVSRRREHGRAHAAPVRCYLSESQAITASDTKRDAQIAELRRQIRVVEDQVAARIVGLRVDQGRAAITTRDQPGCNDDVADLLEITDCSRLLGVDRAIEMAPGLLPTSAIGSAGALKRPAPNRRQNQPALKLATGRRAGRFETCRSGNHCAGREIRVSVDWCDSRLAGETIRCRGSGRPARYAIGTAAVTTAVAPAHPRRRVRPERGSTAMAIETGAPQRVCVAFRDIAGSRHG